MHNLDHEINENILAKGRYKPNMNTDPESKEPENQAERKKYIAKMKDKIKASKKDLLHKGYTLDA